jgi:hypothetical protein
VPELDLDAAGLQTGEELRAFAVLVALLAVVFS